MKKIVNLRNVAIMIACLAASSVFAQSEQTVPLTISGEERSSIPSKVQKSQIITTEKVENLEFIDFINSKGPNSIIYYGPGTTLYKATLSSPLPGTLVGYIGHDIQAAEYIDGILYGISYKLSGNDFGILDQNTGAFSIIKSNFANDASTMCYNPTNGLTYCFRWNGGSFGTIDLTTGDYNQIGTIPTGIIYFATIDNYGVCYAVRHSTGQFGTLNLATGEFTLIANTGISPTYVQDMSTDRETNEIYWLSYTNSLKPILYKIDKTTGALTKIIEFDALTPNQAVFVIATDAPDKCEPISNLNLSVSDSNVDLSWTAPIETPTGYQIDYDGVYLTTVTTTSYTHVNVPDGLHSYNVTSLFSEPCIPVGVAETVVIGDTCIIKIEMYDASGDGWSESHIAIMSGETIYGTGTVPPDSYTSTAFIVVLSGQLDFSWVTGITPTKDDECSFDIYNANGELIYQKTGMLGVSGVFFTYQNDCTPPPPPPPPPPPCEPITDAVVAIDCATSTITWSAVAEAKEYKVLRNSEELGRVTTTEYIENGEFKDGVSYTWKIVTVCEFNESDTIEITGVGECQSINDILNSFTIAPNPAQSSVTIKAGINFTTVEVINFLGKIVISQPVNESMVRLNISGLTNGIYFVRIISESGTCVKKFIKQ